MSFGPPSPVMNNPLAGKLGYCSQVPWHSCWGGGARSNSRVYRTHHAGPSQVFSPWKIRRTLSFGTIVLKMSPELADELREVSDGLLTYFLNTVAACVV
jgi:hypothetical protein